MNQHLATWLRPDALRDAAGAATYARGQDYAGEGRVARLAVEPSGLRGEVVGTRRYQVHLGADEEGLQGLCECPAAQAGGLCKHAVALGLAWLVQLEAQAEAPAHAPRRRGPAPEPRPSTEEATEAWLALHGVVHARDTSIRVLAQALGSRALDRLQYLLPRAASVADAAAGRVADFLGPVEGALLERLHACAWDWLEEEAARVRRGLEEEGARGRQAPTDARLLPLAERLRELRARLRESASPRAEGSEPAQREWNERPPRFRLRETLWALTPGRTRLPVPVEVVVRLPALMEGSPALSCTCTPGLAPSCVHALSALDAALRDLAEPARAGRNASLAEALVERPWTQLLGALEAAAHGAPARAGGGHEVTWRLEGFEGGVPRLEPYLHRPRKGGGLSAGSRLTARDHDVALEAARSPREREALELRLLSQSAYGEDERRIVLRLLRCLAGSPRLFLSERLEAPLEVRELPLGLSFVDEEGGRLRVAPAVGGQSVELDALLLARERAPRGWPWVHLEPQLPRLTLIQAAPAAGSVLEALRDYGARLPAEALRPVLDRLEALESAFPLALPQALEGRSVPPAGTQVVRLQPTGAGGLTGVLRVEPLPEAPLFPPGEGAVQVRATREGERLVTRRDLEAERAEAHALCARLGVKVEGADWALLFEDPTEALSVLERLQGLLSPTLRVEWPEEELRVVAAPSWASLKVEVRKQRDWFGVGGALEVDGTKLTLEQLLEAARTQAHFVPLGKGRFMRLTQSLREQLGALADLAHPTRSGLQLSVAAAPLLEAFAAAGAQVAAPPDWRKLSERIARSRTLEVPVPEGLRAELRDYQREGFVWMARLTEWGAGAALADDMGLGKTLQALALLLHRASRGPALVVAPTSVCFNWEREAARFAPGLTLHAYRESSRGALLVGLGPGDVVVVSYGLVANDVARLAGVQWSTLVVDEAQAMKNPDTQRARALRQLQADARVALTGTPVENRLSELWSLFALLFPGLLGSRDVFRGRFATPIERDGDGARRAALAAVLRPFLLRRTKGQVARELPARTEVVVTVALTPAERRLYDESRKLALAQLGGRASAPEMRIEVLAALTKLRLLACHPRLGDPRSEVPSSKLTRFMELVQELRAEGHRALVFSQFTRHLALVREALDEAGVGYLYLDGSTPPAERAARVDAFQAGRAELFLISLKAGGTGLNLTAADHVIHLDPWWNPAVEDQATDRAHRIGQDKPVTVSRLVSQGTIEEAIVQLHAEKRELAQSLLAGADGAAALTGEQLLALLRFTGAERDEPAAMPAAASKAPRDTLH
ncbi:DEAD/DEAH box helicase [Aggregicoccus sp. 17bor-14]|uniref:DEAD/DEAH box helicase n=1 Tax=Myxococcaceae TaxID=31 RepID=UPI00129C407B|nr:MULTISPECIES: DEAD/DEAH box helicase [Myxococcaceae]MBF5043283.1 DEAD/DEAH box helicase [Simulacricoccus sp. 17bor-14]MRI89041.1 DEAD/DEAH box helicase [Aggregicoccus sp. 17bor-14]